MDTVEIRNNKKQVLNEEDFAFYRVGTIYGLVAGFVMGLFMLLVNSMITEIHTAWSFAKYLILGAALGIILQQYKSVLTTGSIFKNGILLGAFTSFMASIALLVSNTVISLTGVDAIATQRYGLESNSLANMLTINGVLFFECMVFGMIMTFIWLQLLKDFRPAK